MESDRRRCYDKEFPRAELSNGVERIESMGKKKPAKKKTTRKSRELQLDALGELWL